MGITAIPGIEVGHYTDAASATGCTVVLCRQGAVAGVDVRGGAPGTRETDLLRPTTLVERVHAILLTGGSAFGLDAASGVMRYLEEQGLGFRLGPVKVPLVPTAVIFDLSLVTPKVRPGPEEGYRACLAASSGQVQEGSVGAGTGATVGKALGMKRAVKAGLGTALVELKDGVLVGALMVVNAYGGVVDHRTGQLLAGPRGEDGFCDTTELLLKGQARLPRAQATNTTIGVVATNANLTKEQANRLAQSAHNGLAMTIRPCHTMVDGDTIFALATGEVPSSPEMMALGAAAAEAAAQAILRAVTTAQGLGGIPSASELKHGG